MRLLFILILSFSVSQQLNAQFLLVDTIGSSSIRIFDVGDVDGDGYLDIVNSMYTPVAGGINQYLGWYRNTGNDSFDSMTPVDSILGVNSQNGIEQTLLRDMDSDGDLDIVALCDTMIRIYDNDGGGQFSYLGPITPFIPLGLGSSVKRIEVKDINDDNLPDIIGLGSSWGFPIAIVGLINQGGNVYSYQTLIPIGFTNVADFHVVDIDADGEIDILLKLFDSQLRNYRNQGGVFSLVDTIFSSPNSGSYQIIVDDIDLDGDVDILDFKGNSFNHFIHINNNGSFTSIPWSYAMINEPDWVSSVDLDQDNDKDLLYYVDAGYLFWLENEGGGVYSNTPNLIGGSYNPSSFSYCGAWDLDNDSDLDVVNSSVFAWYENYLFGNTGASGKVFADLNQNGVFDSIDVGLNQVGVNSSPLSDFSFSYQNGSYFLNLSDTIGSYSIFCDSLNGWSLTSDSLSFLVSIDSNYSQLTNLDFGFYPDTLFHDLEVDLTGGFPRCNDLVNYWVNIENTGTIVESGIVSVVLDDSLSYVSSSVTPDSIVGQQIFWYFDSLFFFDNEFLSFSVQFPDFNSLGNQVENHLFVDLFDSTTQQFGIVFSDTLEQTVVCAYDPNDKSVTPTGRDSLGYIPSDTETLEYLIRFQNTGNDTAQLVILRDYLDPNLVWSSLDPISSSHSAQVFVEQDGLLTVRFEDIMLPDSATSEIESQGFFKFKISPIEGLAPLTEITNNASIYFDYNPPIITNKVINTIACDDISIPEVILIDSILNTNYSNTSYSFQWFLNGSALLSANDEAYQPVQNGNYSVRIQDSLGCTYESTDFYFGCIGIIPPQVNSFYDSLFIDLLGSSGYQWFLNDTVISGANDFYYVPNANGVYNAVLVDSNGCVVQSDYFLFNSASLSELNYRNEFVRVYPNPFVKVAYIQFISPPKERFDLVVIDNLGREVKTFLGISKSLMEIQKSDIGVGVFHIFLREESGVLNPLGKLVSQ